MRYTRPAAGKWFAFLAIGGLIVSSCTATSQTPPTPSANTAATSTEPTPYLVETPFPTIGRTPVATATGKPSSHQDVSGKFITVSNVEDNTDIFLIDAVCAKQLDGCSANWIRLTDTPRAEPIDFRDLSVSPDGKQLVFAYQNDDEAAMPNWGIYTLTIEQCMANPCKSESFVRLTSSPKDEFAPAWSPKGTLIAFASTQGDEYQASSIYLMAPDGSNQQLLIEQSGFQETVSLGCPSWSPDGTQLLLCVTSLDQQRAKTVFFVYSLAEQTIEPFLDEPADLGEPVNDQHPQWSADGHIIFDTNRFRSVDVANALIGASDVSRLGDGDSPCWSPDGKKIIYIRSGSAGRQLYLMNSDGSDSIRLTRGRHVDSVVWTP